MPYAESATRFDALTRKAGIGGPRRRASRGGAPPRPAGARGDLDARGHAAELTLRPIDGQARASGGDVDVAPRRPLATTRLVLPLRARNTPTAAALKRALDAAPRAATRARNRSPIR